MSFWVVIKSNQYFPRGTHLELTDEGFQKVTLSRKDTSTWRVDKRIGIIVPPSEELQNACIELGKGLPESILAKIREDFNK
jgi:hypothetical protein